MTLHQLDISSTWHFINLTFHQLDISSTWHFINLTFHQIDILSNVFWIWPWGQCNVTSGWRNSQSVKLTKCIGTKFAPFVMRPKTFQLLKISNDADINCVERRWEPYSHTVQGEERRSRKWKKQTEKRKTDRVECGAKRCRERKK